MIAAYSIAKACASPFAPSAVNKVPKFDHAKNGIMTPIRAAKTATDVAYSRASVSLSAPRALATKVPAAIDRPMLIALVKNNNVPAYPTAAANASLPSIDIKIISTRSTAKRVSNPIDVVNDMTATCFMRLPWVNFACTINRLS